MVRTDGQRSQMREGCLETQVTNGGEVLLRGLASFLLGEVSEWNLRDQTLPSFYMKKLMPREWLALDSPRTVAELLCTLSTSQSSAEDKRNFQKRRWGEFYLLSYLPLILSAVIKLPAWETIKLMGPETQCLQPSRLPNVDGFEEDLTQPRRLGPVIMNSQQLYEKYDASKYFEPRVLALWVSTCWNE